MLGVIIAAPNINDGDYYCSPDLGIIIESFNTNAGGVIFAVTDINAGGYNCCH